MEVGILEHLQALFLSLLALRRLFEAALQVVVSIPSCFFSVSVQHDNCCSKSDFGALVLRCACSLVACVERGRSYCFQECSNHILKHKGFISAVLVWIFIRKYSLHLAVISVDVCSGRVVFGKHPVLQVLLRSPKYEEVAVLSLIWCSLSLRSAVFILFSVSVVTPLTQQRLGEQHSTEEQKKK